MKSTYPLSLLIVLMLGVCTNTDAQVLENTSIVTTSSGMRYIGIVTEHPRELFIELADGNEATVFKENIKRYLPAEDISVYKTGVYHMNRGWFTNISLGAGITGDDSDEDTGSNTLHLTFGKYLAPRYALGIGIGSNVHIKDLEETIITSRNVPIFTYGRIDLNDSRRKFFLYGKLGYSFTQLAEEEFVGGFMGEGGLGVLFASSGKAKWALKLGYMTDVGQGSQRFVDDFGNEAILDYNLRFNRVSITFGVEINRKN